jgi:hypothetical protein
VKFLIRKGADPAEASGVLILRDCYTARYRGVKRDDTYGIPQAWVNEFVIASHFDLEKIKRLHSQCSDLLLTRSTWDEIGVEAAAHMGREDIANFFIEKGSPVSLCTACMLGNTDVVKELLREDANRVHERGAHDFPLLWYTIFGKERADLAELLLISGADVHSSMLGNNSLQFARKKGYRRIVDVLQAHGL